MSLHSELQTVVRNLACDMGSTGFGASTPIVTMMGVVQGLVMNRELYVHHGYFYLPDFAPVGAVTGADAMKL